MNKARLMLILLFGFCFGIIAESNITTSLIIPCHSPHIKYLKGLLNEYEKQTILPDEVVISISDVKNAEPALIQDLQNSKWRFPVKFILSDQKLFAGQNRNIACKEATGEIFILQDADDIPHIQRIEVIKYFFEKFELNFLLHKFVYSGNTAAQLDYIHDKSLIQYKYIDTHHEAWAVGYMLFGQPAFRGDIFKKIQWSDVPVGEDNQFDNIVLTTFPNCMMIHVSLYTYYTELSATPYELYRN